MEPRRLTQEQAADRAVDRDHMLKLTRGSGLIVDFVIEAAWAARSPAPSSRAGRLGEGVRRLGARLQERPKNLITIEAILDP